MKKFFSPFGRLVGKKFSPLETFTVGRYTRERERERERERKREREKKKKEKEREKERASLQVFLKVELRSGTGKRATSSASIRDNCASTAMKPLWR